MKSEVIKQLDPTKNYRVFALMLLFFAQAGLDIQHLLNIKISVSVVFMTVLLLYGLKYAIYKTILR